MARRTAVLPDPGAPISPVTSRAFIGNVMPSNATRLP